MLFRRVPTLVGWWEGVRFRAYDYARQRSVDLSARQCGVLGALDQWCSASEVAERVTGVGGRSLTSVLRTLVEMGVVDTSDQPPNRVQYALSSWREWSPQAAFFHFSTRNGRFADLRSTRAALGLVDAVDPMPPSRKIVKGPRMPLPPADRRGAFPRVLLARRTWRRFGGGALTREQLATLLELTWGAQRWIHFRNGRLPLKTAPSGGACHSLEVYVAVRKVEGLVRGVYHYDCDQHSLVRLKHRGGEAWLTRCLAGQSWFGRAAVVMFMTSVFERVQWKYRHSFAYRGVLLEAGHFCQTFCLTATWLRLAPFCTAALAESVIERGLGVDGVRESVLYAAGVGTRPDGVDWAPWPSNGRVPATSLPTYARARRSRGSKQGA